MAAADTAASTAQAPTGEDRGVNDSRILGTAPRRRRFGPYRGVFGIALVVGAAVLFGALFTLRLSLGGLLLALPATILLLIQAGTRSDDLLPYSSAFEAVLYFIAAGALMFTKLPHAVPELFALFLPLAAWMIASRRDDWHELLAATFVTVGIAVPIVLAAAAVEVWVSPRLLAGLGY